jgi:hypothetical protein
MKDSFKRILIPFYIALFLFTLTGKFNNLYAQSSIVWSANMETGNLNQWLTGGVSQASWDSGDCIRPANGVSTEQAHSGIYSMKMTADTTTRESGCRQFRSPESKTGNTYYYSAWLYVPVFTRASSYWNVFQFKSDHCSTEEPFWVVDLLSRSTSGPMYLRLRYKGGNEEVGGPFAGNPAGTKYYTQTIKDVPVGQWTHLEAYLVQSGAYGGHITFWQDGVQIWDMANVNTKYPANFAGCSAAGDERWSINNYSDGLNPVVATLFWDDAAVSTTKTSTPSPTRTPTPSLTLTPIPTATPKPGDANGDGKVDGVDYIIWLSHYNPTLIQSGGANIGDFNTDTKVDGPDYIVWLTNYGK